MNTASTDQNEGTQAPDSALRLFLRGLVIRVGLGIIPVIAMVWMMIVDIGTFRIGLDLLEIRVFSLFGIVSAIVLARVWLKLKSIILYGLIAIILFGVMLFRVDVLITPIYPLQISVLSLMGMVVIQHPFAGFLGWFYRTAAKRAQKRIKTKLKAINAVDA